MSDPLDIVWVITHREELSSDTVVHVSSTLEKAETWMSEQTEKDWERGCFALSQEKVDDPSIICAPLHGFYSLTGKPIECHPSLSEPT